ncbi:MAG TPA: hypothetical protein VJ991_08330 [Balneolales bacterium]|nr:hypothetical protein [Balneolales bacterium]
MKLRYNAIILIITAFLPVSLLAKGNTKATLTVNPPAGHRVNVYIDCHNCYLGYIKSHIKFINYVRDNTVADVYLLISRVGTASGGHEYTMKFIGRHRYADKRDTLNYIASSTDTRDDERKGLVKRIKIGLVPFVINSDVSKYLNIKYEKPGSSTETKQHDHWNHWVFHVDAGTYISGQKTQHSFSLNSFLSAERITNKWKIRFNTSGHFNKNKYVFSDGSETRTHQHSENYNGLVAKSLSPHWSIGLYSNASSSTYNNIDLNVGASPALEYNIFPYSEYSQHELSFRYEVIPYYSNYTHETIYLKNSQFVVKQQLSIHLNLIQPWGEIESRITGSHMLNDFSKNRVDFHASLDIKVFRGLSVHLWGSYSLINDQISLSKQNITNQDVLLNLRQQATSYSFSTSVGIRYTFGSIYNNIVNTRF